jgi:PAS domain S-box-containing protein
MVKEKPEGAEIQILNSQIAALKQLIEVYENSAAKQADKLYGEIAERRRIEHSLTESEGRLRSLLQTIPDLVWQKDVNGVFLACNTMFERFFGARETDIIGKTDYDFVDRELADFFRENDRKAMAAGRPSSNEEWVTFADDGHRALLETIKTPMFDAEGKIIGVLGIARDITERKRIEETLQKSRDFYLTLFKNFPVLFWRAGTDKKSNYFNQTWLKFTGRSLEQERGDGWTEGVHPDDLDHCFATYVQAFDKREPFEMEYRLRHCSGEYRWIVDIGSPFYDLDGEFAGYIGSCYDITERKNADKEIHRLNEELEQKVAERTMQLLNAQEELVRKEKLAILGQLSGSVGHELRNPLGVMSNAVFYLQMVLADADETVQEYLSIIKYEIDNSLRIITDLLDFARTKIPQIQVVKVHALIDESLGRCILPENVELRYEVAPALPSLKIDPLQMGQVMQNLITNGIQAMPAGGVLTLRGVQDNEESVRLEVADTGEGISPENMKKLFQPLFTTKTRGIGLGLVVCKNLVEANGGRIEVESELGKGTTFSAILSVGRGKG